MAAGDEQALAAIVTRLGGQEKFARRMAAEVNAAVEILSTEVYDLVAAHAKDGDYRVRVLECCRVRVFQYLDHHVEAKIRAPDPGAPPSIAWSSPAPHASWLGSPPQLLFEEPDLVTFLRDYVRLAALRLLPLIDIYEQVSGGIAIALAYTLAEKKAPITLLRLELPPAFLAGSGFARRWGSFAASLVPAVRLRAVAPAVGGQGKKGKPKKSKLPEGVAAATTYEEFIHALPMVAPLLGPRAAKRDGGAGGGSDPNEDVWLDPNQLTDPMNGGVAYASAQLRLYVAAALLRAVDPVLRSSGGGDRAGPARLSVTASSRWGLGRKEPSVSHHSGHVFDLWREAPFVPSKKLARDDLRFPWWESVNATPPVTSDPKLRARIERVTHKAMMRGTAKGFFLADVKSEVIEVAFSRYFDGVRERANQPAALEKSLEDALKVLAGTPDHADPDVRRWMHGLLIAVMLAMPSQVIFAGQMAALCAIAAIEHAGLAAQPGLRSWFQAADAAAQRGTGFISFDKPDIHHHHLHVVYSAGRIDDDVIEFWANLGVDFVPFKEAVGRALRDGRVVASTTTDALEPLRVLSDRLPRTSPGALLVRLTDAFSATAVGGVKLLDRSAYKEPSSEFAGVLVPIGDYSVTRETPMEIMDALQDAGTGPWITADTELALWQQRVSRELAPISRAVFEEDGPRIAAAKAFIASPTFRLIPRYLLSAAIAEHVAGLPVLELESLCRVAGGANDLPLAWKLGKRTTGGQGIIGWHGLPPSPEATPRRKGDRSSRAGYYQHKVVIDSDILAARGPQGLRFFISRNAEVTVTGAPDWTNVATEAITRRDNRELTLAALEKGAELVSLAATKAPDAAALLRQECAAQLPLLALVAADYLRSIRRPNVVKFIASSVGPRVAMGK